MSGGLTWLRGVTVVKTSRSVSSSAAGAVLRKLGATVYQLETPPAALGTPRAAVDPASRSLRRVLDLGTELVDGLGSAALELIQMADLVVHDASPAAPQDSNDLAGYIAAVQELNGRAWVTISPFGLTGPLAGRPAAELTSLAAGGLLAYTPHSRDGRRPLRPAGFQASLVAGDVAALAGLHSLSRHLITQVPEHTEISVQEAVIAAGPFFECAHLLFACPGKGGTGRYVAPAGTFDCTDGTVYICALEDHQWAGIQSALGHPAWASSIQSYRDRQCHSVDIDRHLAAWCGTLTKQACADILQAHGVPATTLSTPEDLIRSAQFAARDFYMSANDADGNMTAPSLPVITSIPVQDRPSSPTTRASPSHRRGITGLRILDFSQVLGPPLATSWLGVMGADVIKVEDPGRLETYRRIGPFADGISGVERSAYFAVTNHSKRDLLASLDSLGSDLRQLVSKADVVIENWTMSRAEHVGLRPDTVFELNPGAIMLSSSGFGRGGPMAQYRAYGHNLHAFSGLVHLTRDEESQPCDIGTPWADPLTAIFIATLIGAAALGNVENAAHLDLSMAEVMASHLAEFTAGINPGSGLRGEPSWFEAVYSCAGDDDYLAITIRSDDEWQALGKSLGVHLDLNRSSAGEPDEQAVRTILEPALQRSSAATWAEELVGVGVLASPVWAAADLIADEHLITRNFFPTVNHPVLGERRVVAPPWRFVGEGPLAIATTPLLGNVTFKQLKAEWSV
jgi:crotonobetainyl-CoA:carnitine CoA-transferase CaiB-like acyl-CoA transferase